MRAQARQMVYPPNSPGRRSTLRARSTWAWAALISIVAAAGVAAVVSEVYARQFPAEMRIIRGGPRGTPSGCEPFVEVPRLGMNCCGSWSAADIAGESVTLRRPMSPLERAGRWIGVSPASLSCAYTATGESAPTGIPSAFAFRVVRQDLWSDEMRADRVLARTFERFDSTRSPDESEASVIQALDRVAYGRYEFIAAAWKIVEKTAPNCRTEALVTTIASYPASRHATEDELVGIDRLVASHPEFVQLVRAMPAARAEELVAECVSTSRPLPPQVLTLVRERYGSSTLISQRLISRLYGCPTSEFDDVIGAMGELSTTDALLILQYRRLRDAKHADTAAIDRAERTLKERGVGIATPPHFSDR